MPAKHKDHGILLGVFIFMALLVLIFAVFTIGGKEGLFKETINIYAYFETVEGIRRGAPVRLSGVDVGVVSDISITNDNKVLLALKINKEHQRYIRKNSEASIELEGVVGGRYVSLNYGTVDIGVVSENDFIKTREPFSLGRILQSAQSSVDNAQKLTNDLSAIFQKVNKGKGTIGKLVNDEEIYRVLLSATRYVDTTVRHAASQLNEMSAGYLRLTKSIDRIVTGADSTVASINDIIGKVRAGEGTIWALLTRKDLYDSILMVLQKSIETVNEAKIGASRFAENMEALKHNFLFKGYFEDRGYWEKEQFEKELDEKINFIKKKQEELEKKEKELSKKENEIKNLKSD